MTYDTTLKQGIVNDDLSRARFYVTKFHDVDGVVYGNIDTPHHALVIAEEEDGQAANAIYSDEERTLLIAMDDVEP